MDDVAELLLCAEDIVGGFGEDLVQETGGGAVEGRGAGPEVHVVG